MSRECDERMWNLAYRLAQSGDHQNYRAIEWELQAFGYPQARQLLYHARVRESKLKSPKKSRTQERLRTGERAVMDMFAGPDRNRNIMIAVAVVVIAAIIYLYGSGRLPGI
jgi:hypothetical protein